MLKYIRIVRNIHLLTFIFHTFIFLYIMRLKKNIELIIYLVISSHRTLSRRKIINCNTTVTKSCCSQHNRIKHA